MTSEAPERIWVSLSEIDMGDLHVAPPSEAEGYVEYVRADATPALGAEWMQNRVASEADGFVFGLFDHPRVARQNADAMRRIIDAIPGPTPEQLLAEALRVPEIARLVEAYKWTVDIQRRWENRNHSDPLGNDGAVNLSILCGKATDELQSALAALADLKGGEG